MTCDSSFRCSLASPASYLNPFPKRHRAYGMEPSPFTPTPHAPPAATQSVDASVGHQIGAATSLALTALMGMRLAKTRKVKGGAWSTKGLSRAHAVLLAREWQWPNHQGAPDLLLCHAPLPPPPRPA